MCEVLRNNFDSLLPLIESHITAATFIAVDTEFTGLKLSDKERPSLFDLGEERYQKLRRSVSQFSLPQLGLSAFVVDPDHDNQYTAYSYNFSLFPSSFGPVDVRFVVQASSFEFLSKHHFDFNKYVKEGVSFLNEAQEKKLRRHLQNREHVLGLDRDVDERSLQEYCSKVAAWSIQAKLGDTLSLDLSSDVQSPVVTNELKERFKTVWAKEDDGQIVVEKVSAETRLKFDMEYKEHEEHSIMQRMLGFTRVFKVLVKSQKILVGHNCLTDLLLLYDKFYKPLPESYSIFKAHIREMFPKIFDTKHIVMELRRPLEDTGLFEYTSLGELYGVMRSEKGRLCVLQSPHIHHGENCRRYEDNHHPHEAAYDAFMCGYVFLRIAHIKTAYGIKSSELRPLTFHDYMDSMRPFVYCINMIRGSVNHIKLDEQDPDSQRPQWLLVRSRKSGDSLDGAELAAMFSNYGSVDIRLHGKDQALVAVSNHRSCREILKAFRKNPQLKIVCYDFWKHSLVVKRLLWSGVFIFGSISVLTLYSGLQAGRLR